MLTKPGLYPLPPSCTQSLAANPSCLFTCGLSGAMSAYADAPYAPPTDNRLLNAIVPMVTDPVTAELADPSDCAEAALGQLTNPCLAPVLPDGKTMQQKRAKKIMYNVAGLSFFL